MVFAMSATMRLIIPYSTSKTATARRHSQGGRTIRIRGAQSPLGEVRSVDRRFLVEHIAGSLVDMLIRWARTAFAADPRLLAESYIALTKPLFR